MKFVPLNAYLKLKNVATSGGEAKNYIKDGFIKVNGNVETRNKKKLVAGDVVEIDGKRLTVKKDEIFD